ncbi:hypothetical protein CDEST_14601 [Colletotrichum destructivum]|uniref:Uncharacterized protein n=1 Tax=Colletotrichum destructivum TaxID=34406 RepID=A0AAX4J1Z8_9PEZI|nr:hypothetical protein CDEST_14601 [Colletotrichum destructivum]
MDAKCMPRVMVEWGSQDRAALDAELVLACLWAAGRKGSREADSGQIQQDADLIDVAR